MDIQLIALIGMVIVTVLVSIKTKGREWPGQPGYEYQRVFTAAAVGLLFFIAGLIGWDLSYSRGWFEGTKWVDGPVWWQVGLGAASLALAAYWARRVPLRRTTR